MLMISNVGTIAVNISSFQWCKQKNTFINVATNLTESIQDGFYGVAHWILASKYNQIASEIPYLIYEVSIPASLKACHQRMYWIFLILNTLPAILGSVLNIPYNQYYYIVNDPAKASFFGTAEIPIFFFGFGLGLVTMYVLLLSVYKIRNFYRDNKLTEEMNTKAMVFHVLAFGLYVVSVLLIDTSLTLLIIRPSNPTFFKVFEICELITTATATLSQVLLCAIFWQLGAKLEETPQKTQPEEPLLVKTFDNEDELQARIWNAFNLRKLEQSDFIEFAESFKGTVTAEMIMNSRLMQQKDLNQHFKTEQET